MPSFQEFLDQIKLAGILVQGESVLVDKASSSANWPAEVAVLARTGRKDGVVFDRTAAHRPSNDQLANILRSYAFTLEDANAVGAQRRRLGQRRTKRSEMPAMAGNGKATGESGAPYAGFQWSILTTTLDEQ